MESDLLSDKPVFANDNSWDEKAAIMFGRFLALHQFRERYCKNLSALAISPEFFFYASKLN